MEQRYPYFSPRPLGFGIKYALIFVAEVSVDRSNGGFMESPRTQTDISLPQEAFRLIFAFTALLIVAMISSPTGRGPAAEIIVQQATPTPHQSAVKPGSLTAFSALQPNQQR